MYKRRIDFFHSCEFSMFQFVKNFFFVVQNLVQSVVHILISIEITKTHVDKYCN